MKYFKQLWQNNRGMAMVIVLTASFVVLVTIGVSVAMIANNIDKVTGGANRDKALANAQQGLERARGKYFLNNALFDSCNAGDCIDTNGITSCGACAGLLFGSASNGNRVEVDAITPPTGGLVPAIGSATLLATGYYKNTARQKAVTICLNYCSSGNYNCGDDGCGGSCGSCVLPQTCQSGVCSGPPTSCNDIAVECGDECVAGDICGGGSVIDATNNIVAVAEGCQDESGSGCAIGGGEGDTLTKAWDNSGGGGDTGAVDSDDGRNNSETLRNLGGGNIDAIYEAVKFCDDLSTQGFSNWYLPASNELDLLSTANQNAWATGFVSSCYWSSTENGANDAYNVNMNIFGLPCGTEKSNTYYVRCLRRY